MIKHLFKHARVLLLGLTALAAACSTPLPMLAGPSEPLAGKLRFDGLYQSEERQTTTGVNRRYFRFFPDGTVSALTTNAPPSVVFNPLRSNPVIASIGQTVVKGQEISFATYLNGARDIDYAGRIEGNTLRLDAYAYYGRTRIDGYTYTFIAVTP